MTVSYLNFLVILKCFMFIKCDGKTYAIKLCDLAIATRCLSKAIRKAEKNRVIALEDKRHMS
jgi:hypothetical protein